ncbi:MAG: hypothetical protein ACJA0T_001415 [Colwellia sp.]|jgi:hypothetical protein
MKMKMSLTQFTKNVHISIALYEPFISGECLSHVDIFLF